MSHQCHKWCNKEICAAILFYLLPAILRTLFKIAFSSFSSFQFSRSHKRAVCNNWALVTLFHLPSVRRKWNQLASGTLKKKHARTPWSSPGTKLRLSHRQNQDTRSDCQQPELTELMMVEPAHWGEDTPSSRESHASCSCFSTSHLLLYYVIIIRCINILKK